MNPKIPSNNTGVNQSGLESIFMPIKKPLQYVEVKRQVCICQLIISSEMRTCVAPLHHDTLDRDVAS